MRLCTVVLFCAALAHAEDWPEWRGQGRMGIWREAGIVKTFPAEGLRFRWRAPVHGGYAGPAVAAGRVFVTDFRKTQGTQGIERILALDEISGKVLWTHK